MTESSFDYSEYGVFNGKPTITNYNREARRKYIKDHKHIKGLKLCPHCENRTVFITDDNNNSFCELCGKLYPKLMVKTEDGDYKPILPGVIEL